MCEYKGYEVYKVYEDAGISAKTGNKRPAFNELLQDIKDKKCNTIVVLKLDRLTRSVYDWENILMFLEENNDYLDCANDDINTRNANGKMISRILTSVSQQEIADYLKVSRGTYAMYECGYNIIPLHLLDKLSIKYQVSIDYLVGVLNNKNDSNIKPMNFNIMCQRLKSERIKARLSQQ